MSLLYYFGFDAARFFGGFSVTVTDEVGTFTVTITEGTFAHVDLSSVMGTGEYVSFAAHLQSRLNALKTGAGTYAVTWQWNPPFAGYTITYDDIATYDLTGSDAQVRMRQILGLSGDKSGDEVNSDVRPFYVISPATQCRSMLSDESDSPESATEETNDSGGTVSELARDTDETWFDWAQTGEDPNDLPTAFNPGGPVFKRQETSALPFSWQRAWEHHQRYFDPIYVASDDDSDVVRLRDDNASWEPERMGSDYDAWTIRFRTRLLGRIP